ncbi:peptidoglycan DD-metalloendopeptidase family protein [Mesorhizobium sp. L-8-3]|uniref:peptidoglycan DD-metalloendopeptidase family protein n=1 Tax=Mesorhizobium sp. L-8-3 TaxID=2744522 RepID=UPI001926D6BE|nr:M23 family metallopeptidase [Mesorhizobium sp. L-8-3]BCH25455.1 peptidase M23 [Mesorhizobium sp. L-8-3]
MTHGIDASFRLKKQALAAYRRRARRRKVLAACGALLVLALVAGLYVTASHWLVRDDDDQLEMAESSALIPADAPVYVPAIVDLPGDPMWISLTRDSASATQVRSVERPAALAGAGISPQIEILSDVMLSSSERFMTTIPSTQEDFAFFQAQRTATTMPAAGAPADLEAIPATDEQPRRDQAGTEALSTGDSAAGWGQTISSGVADLPDFDRTEIENNTAAATVTPEQERFETTEDSFVKVLVNRSLDSVVLEGRFSSEDAELAGEAMKAFFHRDTLEPGFVVALRGFRTGRRASMLSLKQVSIYGNDKFVGTLARDASGRFGPAADPWVRDNLFNYSGEPKDSGPKRQYRLLDAIYSTAARNSIPTAVIGEAIMHLSRGQDLNAFAAHDDRLVLIYSNSARSKDGVGGRVLYVAVQGAEKMLECFVFRQGDGEFACVSRDDQVRSLTVTNGMVTPVNGVLTSTFGPRMHPILKTVRIHKGVDWMAPVGTPVFAAFDGEIAFQGSGGDYGNLVRISHADGRETRYAHLQRFAMNDGVGTSVKAGDVIGYVGTTGLSTGPHLHFELHRGIEAIDPLGTTTVVASDNSAVEALTDRIIRVESANDPRAKNPLSTATGLGQFIESTWIRMMNTYRPDLARTLSRAELLALRFDATLSREMVLNLAREGEAYLRARGHQVTASRLYLCHFLGAEGANQILSSPGDKLLAGVLSSDVIRANPFLAGRTVNYLVNWAEAKMRGRRGIVATQPASVTREIKQTSPEFEQYKAAISGILPPQTSL